jgi:transcriptional regulator GlxA family with amidase domain
MKTVGAFIFDQMTMLDVLAPHQLLGLHPEFRVVTIAPTPDPITTDTGLRIVPDHSVHDAPEIDVLLTGGAGDVLGPLTDPDVIDWFRRAGAQAGWVTSVCSGSLFLAEAGLLDGYRAATHWAYLPFLASYPQVTVSDERVVRDRNRITAGGVTAGIDFALTFLTEACGPESAAMVQLITQYEPLPPGPNGHPRTAAPEVVSAVTERLEPIAAGLAAFYAAKAALDPKLDLCS